MIKTVAFSKFGTAKGSITVHNLLILHQYLSNKIETVADWAGATPELFPVGRPI